jgi:hypothetical protein
MNLSIIILNWNAGADTLRCIREISTWQNLHTAVWIVDNHSSDNSPENIAREHPDVHIIRNMRNLGFAGGNNKGIVEALVAGDAPILLLNNDASITEENVIRLIETLQANPKIGFVGPLLFDAEQKDKLLSAGGRSPLHHHSHIYNVPENRNLTIVDYVPGTVIIGRAEVFREVGFLDEDYFFSTEIADLCMRARRHGYLSVIDTRARAFHDIDRSSSMRNSLYTYYIVRNRFLFIRKFHPRQRVWFYGVWGLYSLALALKIKMKGNTAMARAVWLGLVDGLRGRFGKRNELFLQ